MKKIIRFTAALLAMAAMLLCFVPQGSAPVRAADSLDDLYKQLQDILKQQADYDALINSTQGELAEIEVQVNQLSGEIQLYEDKIQIYADIIAGLDAQIAELEASIAKNEEDLQAYYKIYFERVRLNYEQGQTTYLEVLLGAGSFTDYLTRLDVVEQIMAYDNNLIKLMQDTIETIRTQKAKVEEKRAENQAAKDELTAQQDKLVALRSQAQAMASEMNDRIARYEAEKEAAEAAKEEINKRIDDLINPDNPYVGGSFTWPTPGITWITSRFGYRTDPFTGETRYHGAIDIGAPYGTALHATNSGTVVIVDYEGAGGYYIAIDHGGGISSRYYHLSAQYVVEGQTVARGEVIGRTGNSGYATTGPHLHFEIRVKNAYGVTERVNPLDYVTPY